MKLSRCYSVARSGLDGNKVCIIGLCRFLWQISLASIVSLGVSGGGRHSFGAVRFVSSSMISLSLYALVMVGGRDNVVGEDQLRCNLLEMLAYLKSVFNP